MGWTSYRAIHYKNGTVDRKAECDSYFDYMKNSCYRLKKSALVGSTYYAAVAVVKDYDNDLQEIPEDQQRVIGIVILTSVDMKDDYNFSYKLVSEDMGPVQYDCPESILKLLSPAESNTILQWRSKCHKHTEARKTLNRLSVGSVIEFIDRNGATKRYTKSAPAFQFKRNFWYNPEKNCYIPVHYIPDDFRIVK